MKQLCFRVLLLIGLVVSGLSLAAIDTYEFADEQTRERFHQLNEELRCPKCQNQALGDSNSAIATDLRREVYRLLNEGRTDRQIKDFLVARYGEYILYRPELSSHTLMLWLAPLLMLLIGLVVVLVLIKRRRSVVQSTTLNVAEQENLKTLLEGSDTSSQAGSNKRD
jgi:cytochrome c-type biogenesis protein CcmH